MTNPADVHPDLLEILGFTSNAKINRADVEDARLRMCAALGVDSNSADEVLVGLGRRTGYKPATGNSEGKTKPAVDPGELSQIGRGTKAGLQAIKSGRQNTQSGIKPLSARHIRGTPKVDSGDAAQAADAEEPSEEQLSLQATSQRLKGMQAAIEPEAEPGVFAKVLGAIKKILPH